MKSTKNIGLLMLFIFAILMLLLFGEKDTFPIIILGYGVAFISYFLLMKSSINFRHLMLIGWVLRIICVFIFPMFSDDIYRFIWDGWLLTEGTNPFTATPASMQENLPEFQQYLKEKMNSPDYFSVYPAILQLIFFTTVSIIPKDIYFQSVFLKLILLAFEAITVFYSLKILRASNTAKRNFLIYFLNPLVIIELMGNLHMELVMISGFSAFLFYFFLGKSKASILGIASFSLSFSVASKLITLLVSPFLFKRLGFKNSISFFVILIGFLIMFFLPLFLSTYENFSKGLNLYFQKFEFNASIYYVIRQMGYWWKGYNIIGSLGPILAIISGFAILILAYFEKAKDIKSLCKYLTFGLMFYYGLGTTIHPWYTALLVFLAVFSDLKFPIFWSFLAVLSYAKYYENGIYYPLMVSLEYSILIILMILEWKNINFDKVLSFTKQKAF